MNYLPENGALKDDFMVPISKSYSSCNNLLDPNTVSKGVWEIAKFRDVSYRALLCNIYQGTGVTIYQGLELLVSF